MLNQQLEEYIKNMKKSGFKDDAIKQKLIQVGWKEKQFAGYFQKPKQNKGPHLIITIIIIFLVIIVSVVFFYFNFISPIMVSKPEIMNPLSGLSEEEIGRLLANESLAAEVIIDEDHISYVVNELGGYKLHADPVSKEEAIMEFIITDANETYTVTIEDNSPVAMEGKASSPDLRITSSKQSMIMLLTSNDFTKSAIDLVTFERITIEILADEATLALKGYKSIYDSLQEDSDTPIVN